MIRVEGSVPFTHEAWRCMAGLPFMENHGYSTSSHTPGHRSPWPSRVGAGHRAQWGLPGGLGLLWSPHQLGGGGSCTASGLPPHTFAACSPTLVGADPHCTGALALIQLLLPSLFTGVTPQQTHRTATIILATSPQSPKLTAGVQMAPAPTQSLLKFQKQGRNTRE